MWGGVTTPAELRAIANAVGMDFKETEHLCKVAAEDEVFEIIAAFVQLYRENSRYLHRISKWVAAVGLDWCRDQVVGDPENRRALYDRFMNSQSVYQTDLWAEHATPNNRPRWGALADLTMEAAE